jgi:hypothetical protein
MVYRLYRANRFLIVRIFSVVLFYSILIGAIGFLLLGVVIKFDSQSFTPQLIDSNAQSTDTNNPQIDSGKICENYLGDACSWYIYGDLVNRPIFERHREFLESFKERIDQKNLLVLEDDFSGTFLVETRVNLDSRIYSSSTNSVQDTQNSGDFCMSLQESTQCHTKIISQPSFQYIPNLREYSSDFNPSGFLGSQVLLKNNTFPNQPEILCTSYPANCPYVFRDTNIYTYVGPDNTLSGNVTAYQAIIKPNTKVSNIFVNGLNDNNVNINIICIVDSNSCDNINLFSSDSTFLFQDSNTNIRPGYIKLNVLNDRNEEILDLQKDPLGTYHCSNDNGNSNLFIGGQTPISCGLGDTQSTKSTSGSVFKLLEFPLYDEQESSVTSDPKVLLNLNNSNNQILIKFGTLKQSSENKSSPKILLGIISNPTDLLKSLFNNEISSQVLGVSFVSFIVNIFLSFFMIITRFWRRIGGFLGSRSTLLLRGRFGRLLELTQFFEFGGSWYLEAHGVIDYNFKSTMGVVHELVRERWRDTIFFPTALAASISILMFTIFANSTSLLSLIVFGGLLPLLLAFWTPALWVIEDSGLKRAEWSGNGELLAIQKISVVIRDGFNKLVGFGAIFGVGTAGASIARAEILGDSVNSTTAITGGLESILNLNWNFLISAILWTIALLFIVTAVSLTGNVLTSLSYLNTDHLSNVKKMRTQLQKKDVFLGTTQQAMDHTKSDTSIYFDSKRGIDDAFVKTGSTKSRIKPMPVNTVIEQEKITSEDDLTKIIITEPEDQNGANIGESDDFSKISDNEDNTFKDSESQKSNSGPNLESSNEIEINEKSDTSESENKTSEESDIDSETDVDEEKKE